MRFYEASLSPRAVKNLELRGVKEVAWFAKESQRFINLRYLTICDLNGEVPEDISDLDKLWELAIINCHLEKMPSWVRYLPKLNRLIWRGTQLKEVPPFVWRLHDLIRLDLGNNRLTEISPEIEQLSKLNQLTVSDNELTDFPLVHFPRIKLLKLHNNPYTPETWNRIVRHYLPGYDGEDDP